MADELILAVETSTGCGSVSLTRGTEREGRIVAEYTLQPETSHSRRLLGSIQAMMAAANVHWRDLAAVAVSQGPGSFTGLRIGLAAAKGMAMAADLPLIGVPTLDALSLLAHAGEFDLCCLLDARKQQVYAAFYRAGVDGICSRTSAYLALTPTELLDRIVHPTLLIGPGVRACAGLTAGRTRIRMAPAGLCLPRAALVGFCAAHRLEGSETAETDTLTPLYIRASEAELNLQGHTKGDHD